MSIDYNELKLEIDNDPFNLGYKQGDNSWRNDNNIASRFNEVPPSGIPGREVDREIVDTWEILEATTEQDWGNLSNQEKTRYQTIVSVGKVKLKGTGIRAQLNAMFNNGTATRDNLVALRKGPASRAEVLFNEPVNYWDVGRARLL